MNLREYLFVHRINVTDFSKTIDCSRSYLSSIMNGSIKPGKKLARQIEKATEGKVTREELLFPQEHKNMDVK